MHVHTNMDMFGILLHNHQHFSHTRLHLCAPRSHLHNAWEKVFEEEIAPEWDEQLGLKLPEISNSGKIFLRQSSTVALRMSTRIQSTGLETVTLSQYAIWGRLAESIGLIDSDLFPDSACCTHSPRNNGTRWNLSIFSYCLFSSPK